MKRTLRLKPYVRSENTLLICSMEFGITKYTEFRDNTFIHFVPGSRLLRYDPDQREVLQYYVERKQCSQLIFVGTRDLKFMEQIQSDETLHHLRSTLNFHLTKFLKHPHKTILAPDIQMQMLIELNVIQQCKLLMDYFFINERVEKNTLQVKGVVTEIFTDQLKSIFQNGIVYNDILTLN